MSEEQDVEPGLDIGELRRRYPYLIDEILGDRAKKISFKIHIVDPWRNYTPTAVDYIRRCKTIEEAFEVIEYLLKRNEISLEEAEALRNKLRNGGIEAFGGRKEDNYYYKQAKRYWNLLKHHVGDEDT